MMSDSDEDLGFQLKTLKIADKAAKDSLNNKNIHLNKESDLSVPYLTSTHTNEQIDEIETDEMTDARSVDGTSHGDIDPNTSHENSAGPGIAENYGAMQSPTEDVINGTSETSEAGDETHEVLSECNREGQGNDLKLKQETESGSDSETDGEWQNMAAIASCDVYNDKGELELRTYESENMKKLEKGIFDLKDDDQNTNAGKKVANFGYTKVAAEEQAQRSYLANRKTDFLFETKRIKQFNSSKNSLSTGSDLRSQSEIEKDQYDEYEDDVSPTDDIDADTQLNITKDLLNDREKIAYVGAINVLSNQLCTDLATLCLCADVVSHKKLAQRLQFAQKDTAKWKTDVLNRLYEHLGISKEEIQMVEKLSIHGIQLEDLCKCLKTTQSIENPFDDKAEDEDDYDPQNEPRDVEDEGTKSGDSEVSTKSSIADTTDLRKKSGVEGEFTGDNCSITDIPSDKNLNTVQTDNKSDGSAPSVRDDYTAHPREVPGEVIQLEHAKNEGSLEVDVAWTIICDLFLLLLQDAVYDARSRTLLIKFGEVLNVSKIEICEFERRVTDSLDMEQSTEDQIWNESQHMKDRRKKRRRKKMCYVGLAMVGGSLILGLSGGLLAPVIGAGIAAGLSTIGITGATGFLTGAGGATVVALTSTAIGGKIGAKGMSRRMGSIRTFEFRPLHNNRRVNLIITVSGWMIGNVDDVRLPYSTVDPVEGDLYSVHWEPEMLKSIGQTINIVANEVFTQVVQQVLGATILTAFISAIQWPMGLSKLGYILDNPWSVSLDRAWSAGLILADTLMSRNLGERPVTLMGFSLGSRVIYSCLVELSKRKAHGLVENVFIFGTPVVRKREHLVMARSVVSGRFVNAYSLRDWMLAYLFRAAAGGFSKVMGITPIENIEGIENFDCTETVDGHLAYRKNMPKLLKQLGVSVVNDTFVEIEETMDPEKVKRQRKLVDDVDAAQRKLLEKKKHGRWIPKWMKPKKSKWRTMVEDAVEEAKNLEETKDIEGIKDPKENGSLEEEKEDMNTDPPPEPSLRKKRDNFYVDHGALMHELQLIKAALHEDQINSKSSSNEEFNEAKSTSPKVNENIKNQPRHSSSAGPSSNNFQLLTAGKPILPEDDYTSGKQNDMKFSFSDDF